MSTGCGFTSKPGGGRMYDQLGRARAAPAPAASVRQPPASPDPARPRRIRLPESWSRAAYVAAALALASSAVSLFWTVGGTWLLDNRGWLDREAGAHAVGGRAHARRSRRAGQTPHRIPGPGTGSTVGRAASGAAADGGQYACERHPPDVGQRQRLRRRARSQRRDLANQRSGQAGPGLARLRVGPLVRCLGRDAGPGNRGLPAGAPRRLSPRS